MSYTIKDSFIFAEEFQSFDPKPVVASFDKESLFTNIHLQETIDLCVENLFEDWIHVNNLSKGSFGELLTRTMYESLILFDQKFYNSTMELQWVPHYDLHLSMFFFVIMKKITNTHSLG